MKMRDMLYALWRRGTRTSILPWGTYNTVGDYTLSKPITDYKWLRFQLGSATNLASGGGSQSAYFPVDATDIGSSANYGVNYYLNGKWYNITFSFTSATVLHIQSVYNITDKNTTIGSGIRRIDGII